MRLSLRRTGIWLIKKPNRGRIQLESQRLGDLQVTTGPLPFLAQFGQQAIEGQVVLHQLLQRQLRVLCGIRQQLLMRQVLRLGQRHQVPRWRNWNQAAQVNGLI